jgi:hypothetical protein
MRRRRRLLPVARAIGARGNPTRLNPTEAEWLTANGRQL